MKKLFTLLAFSFTCQFALAITDGHTQTSTLGYFDGTHPRAYTVAPNMLQSAVSLGTANSTITGGDAADVYVAFPFDMTGKSIYLVYTTNGSAPTKTVGTVVTISSNFSKFTGGVHRVFFGTIPGQSASTVVKYVFYASDGTLANGWGRVSGNSVNTSGWTEGDAFISYTVAAPLSVETTSFSVKKASTSTLLTWLTSSEKDNALFQIERASNATDFSPIGEVKGSGNSTAAKNYTFTDVAPLSGVNYYRLKAIDYNGTATLSKVVSVNFSSKNDTKIAVYPNPTRDVLRVDVNATEAATTLVQVSDLMGRVVLSQSVTVNKGANLLPFSVSSLPSGTYFVKVNGDVTRFVKQ